MLRLMLTGAAIAVLGTGTAYAIIAQPGAGAYNGQFAGDPYPGSSISFNVKRTDSGARRVVKVIASGMAYTCKNGASGDSSAISLDRGFRVRRDRTFGGMADATVLGYDPPARFAGKLRRNGRAVGTLRVYGELEPQQMPGVHCNTGRQEWRAKKGPRSR